MGFKLSRPKPNARLKKLEADALEQETIEMERKMVDLKLHLQQENVKQFHVSATRFNAADRGPIRNYGSYIVNQHKGIEPSKVKSAKTKTNFRPNSDTHVAQQNFGVFENDIMNETQFSQGTLEIDKSHTESQTGEILQPGYQLLKNNSTFTASTGITPISGNKGYNKNNYMPQNSTEQSHSIAIGTDPIIFDDLSESAPRKTVGIGMGMGMGLVQNPAPLKQKIMLRRDGGGSAKSDLGLLPPHTQPQTKKKQQFKLKTVQMHTPTLTNPFPTPTPTHPETLPIKATSSEKVLKLSGLSKFAKSTPQQASLDLLSSRIQARMDSDERDIEKFLGGLELMRYYDKFWDYGLTNKDLLLNCGIEDLNAMFIPAGHQIKIEIELGKLKAEAGLANGDVGCGTDDMETELDPKYLNVNEDAGEA